MKKHELHKEFNQYLAGLGVAIFKLHNLHWNVTGPQFMPIHKFTEELYDEFFEFFDAVAEHQKIFGVMPDCKMSDYLKNSQIKEIEPKDFSGQEVLEIVKADLTTLKEEAIALRAASDELGYFDAVALFEGHLEYYNKQLWFISATLA